MSAINLKLSKALFVPKFYPMLFDYSHRVEAYMGSAGSAKSYFITQKLIVRACSEEIKILVCRKYGTTIRNTCFSLFKDILRKWKLYPDFVTIRESDFNIKFPNGSEIIFTGLDEETKLLSLNNISVIFIEEAFEISKDLFEQLNFRLRGNAKNQQIILAFNPISKQSWLYEMCEANPPHSFIYIHSTFRDNPFLSKEYVDALEEMYVRNPTKARIFCDGEWGIDAEGLVIKNWKMQDFNELELAKIFDRRFGLDLGYIDPTAAVDSLYDKENKTIYVFKEFYRSGCQLSEIVSALIDMNVGKSKVWVDSAEPRSIANLRANAINAVGAIKGQDSVKAGISFLQDHLIIVHPRCKNLMRELENFSYIKSKQTGEWTEETTHEFSHSIDALRYAYSDIYRNAKLKTVGKANIGIW